MNLAGFGEYEWGEVESVWRGIAKDSGIIGSQEQEDEFIARLRAYCEGRDEDV